MSREPSEKRPDPGLMNGRGLITHGDGERVARVTRSSGTWGYWENGTRTGSFPDRGSAAQAFLDSHHPATEAGS